MNRIYSRIDHINNLITNILFRKTLSLFVSCHPPPFVSWALNSIKDVFCSNYQIILNVWNVYKTVVYSISCHVITKSVIKWVLRINVTYEIVFKPTRYSVTEPPPRKELIMFSLLYFHKKNAVRDCLLNSTQNLYEKSSIWVTKKLWEGCYATT